MMNKTKSHFTLPSEKADLDLAKDGQFDRTVIPSCVNVALKKHFFTQYILHQPIYMQSEFGFHMLFNCCGALNWIIN